jgi:hypothetical protein
MTEELSQLKKTEEKNSNEKQHAILEQEKDISAKDW